MTWTIDPSHTSLDFSVRHMGIATVRGTFDAVSGTIELDTDGAPTAIDAAIKAASISTRDENRDQHLRSPDFLHVEKYPDIRFRSTDIRKLGDRRYHIHGELEIRGQSRPVDFEAEASQVINDPFGLQRVAVTASGKLNRKDWGLTWNQVLEAGALMVGEEVTFTLDLEATAAKETVGAA